MWRHNVQISGGFWLLLGWFGLANGWGLLGVVVSAAALHELGHYIVLLLCGAHIRGMRLGICGAVLETDTGCLSYGAELAAVLAGPGVNLLCAVGLMAVDSERWAVAAGAHLVLCTFNLLPLRPLDGGRALYLLTAWGCGPVVAENATRTVGALCGFALAGVLCWLMWQTKGSLWLLPAAGGLLGAAVQECSQRRKFL